MTGHTRELIAHRFIDLVLLILRDICVEPPPGATPIVDMASIDTPLVGIGLEFAGCRHVRAVDWEDEIDGARNCYRAIRSIVDDHRDNCSS